MTALLANLKLSLKLLIAPALAITFLVFEVVLGYWGLYRQGDVIEKIYGDHFVHYQRAGGAGQELSAVHSSVYRLLSLYAAKAPAEQADALARWQLASLDRQARAFEELDRHWSREPATAPLGQVILSTLPQYRTGLTRVLQLAATDPDAANTELSGVETKFQELRSLLQKLLALEQRSAYGSYIESRRQARAGVSLFLISSALAVALSTALSLYVARFVAIPIRVAERVIRKLTAGDLSARTRIGGTDELASMCRNLNVFAEKLESLIADVAENGTIVAAAASQLDRTAEHTAADSERLAVQAASVASAADQMSATSADISESCGTAAAGVERASRAAETGAGIVAQTVDGMGRIAEKVRGSAGAIDSLGARGQQIGQIVGTIEEIADQTNLLALNAAIEAARAGEQGRGFAVVADEVRKLAERTRGATGEIGEMIRAIQMETQSAVTAMNEGVKEVERGTAEAARSGEALGDILQQVDSVTGQVRQMAAAAEEQTVTTREISQNIQEVNVVVEQLARGAQDSASAARQLSRQAEALQAAVARFRDGG